MGGGGLRTRSAGRIYRVLGDLLRDILHIQSRAQIKVHISP